LPEKVVGKNVPAAWPLRKLSLKNHFTLFRPHLQQVLITRLGVVGEHLGPYLEKDRAKLVVAVVVGAVDNAVEVFKFQTETHLFGELFGGVQFVDTFKTVPLKSGGLHSIADLQSQELLLF
jgi:hypothetical protein